MRILDRLRLALASPDPTERSLLRPLGRLLWVWQRDGGRACLASILRRAHAVRYSAWIAQHEPTAGELASQRRAAGTLGHRPLISVIIPLSASEPPGVRESIASITNQTYDRWEVCLATPILGDAGPGQTVLAWAKRDPRIRTTPGHPSVLAAMVEGEFLAPRLPGDRLAARALVEVVKRLNADPSLDLLYTDEDVISADGRGRRDPFFKPDWSPELLLSVNYLTPPVIRRQLVERAGGVSPDLDDAAIWDLVLRCAERTDQIAHVPRVLYHRRQGRPPADPGGRERQSRSLEAHLRRSGISGPTVVVSPRGVVRVEWAPRGAHVSIIVPNKDHETILRRCATSILERTSYRNFDVLIVDNGTTDPGTQRYYASLAANPGIRIVQYPGEFNYSRVNNLGARHASGDLLLFLNNDVEVIESGWLEELVRWAELPQIGAVGAKLLYAHGSIQHAGVIIGMDGLTEHVYRDARRDQNGPFGSVNWYRNYMAVTGACVMMRRSVFDEVGGFDETYELAGSDIALCLSMVEHGYRIVYTPFAQLHHYEGATRGRYAPAEDTRKLHERIQRIVDAGDRYFNPNLSYATRLPTLVQNRGTSRRGEVTRVRR